MTSETGPEREAAARQRHAEGDYRAALTGYEDAFVLYQADGEFEAAARAARTIAWFRGWVLGEWAISQGWSQRADSLLERAGSRSALGWLRYGEATRGSNLESQRGHYLEAINIARSCGDADLECEATASMGMMLVFSGAVDEGMAHLDHALATICGGAVTELPVVEGCLCGLLNACERAHDIQRAQEWLGAADEVMRRGNLSTVAGYCRAHYASILVCAGRWPEAEVELARARGSPASSTHSPLGEIYRHHRLECPAPSDSPTVQQSPRYSPRLGSRTSTCSHWTNRCGWGPTSTMPGASCRRWG